MASSDDGEVHQQAAGSKGKWWKLFNIKSKEPGPSPGAGATSSAARVFGVSLQQSLGYASVAISQLSPDGKSALRNAMASMLNVRPRTHLRLCARRRRQDGPVSQRKRFGLPFSRSRCGADDMLGTTTQGIFRVSGSNKRIKELEQTFDSPPR
jgi:hypothetical protein